MLSFMTASAGVVVTFDDSDVEYYWHIYDGSMTKMGTVQSKDTVPLPSGMLGGNKHVQMQFQGRLAFTFARNTTVKFIAPDGYRIRSLDALLQIDFDNDGVTSLDGYSYSSKYVGDTLCSTWSSYDAPLKELSFTINSSKCNARCFRVTLVKDVECWLPDETYVGVGETKVAGLKQSDFDYTTPGFDYSILNTSIASYDGLTDSLTGISIGKTQITLNFPADENYAKGQKIIDLNVVDMSKAHVLHIPQSDRYTITVTRNGNRLLDGVLVFDTDELTYHAEASSGYRIISPIDTILTGNDYYPAPVALKVDADDADEYLLIGDTADWDGFAKYYYNASKYRLSADIGPTTTMVGSEDKPFKGIFDGQGHTLTVNYNNDTDIDVAPFRFALGSTFTNLRTAGTISASKSPGMASGLIGDVIYGGYNSATTIRNCESAVALTFTGSGDATFGGFVGRINSNVGSVFFYDCLFSGSIAASDGKNVGGFIGWNNGWAEISNSLVAADINVKEGSDANGSATFARSSEARKIKIYNSFYRDFDNIYDGFRQGSKVTDEQMASGEAAWLLQANRDEYIWGQNITGDDKEAHPMLTTDKSERVWRATFKAWDTPLYYAYGNNGKLFNFDGRARRITSDVIANGNMDVNAFRMSDGYILIEQNDDWDFLADAISKGYSGDRTIQVRLMNNLNVGSMMGSEDKPFRGIFDGNGHNINVNYNFGGTWYQAPFRTVRGATIQNLSISGRITYQNDNIRSYRRGHRPGGLVGKVTGEEPTLISRCSVNTYFNCELEDRTRTQDYTDDSDGGGIVGYVDHSNLTIDNCIFNGYFRRAIRMGGFVGGVDGQCLIKNSLMIGSGERNRGQVGNFFMPGSGGQLENCYYLYRFPADQRVIQGGTETDYATLASGKITWLLQGDQPNITWGQDIGSDNMPLLTTNDAKRVFRATFTFGDTIVVHTVYANKDKQFNLTGRFASLTGNQPATKDVSYKLFDLDKDGYAHINNTDDWNTLAQCNSLQGNYRLMNDINVNTMVSSFHGTFDGQGHTLTVNLNYNGQMVAPFSSVKDATIKHLKTAGTVTANDFHASGLVGRSFGVTIDNCEVDVDVQYTKGGDAHNGGFVGHGGDNDINITNSAFNGKFSSPNNQSFYGVGGFVGWGGTNISIKNCYAHYPMGQGCQWYYPFVYKSGGNITLENCYAANAEYGAGAHFDTGNENCTQVSRSQVESGEMAYKLQGTQENLTWGQAVGTDEAPQLTTDDAKRVLENVYDDGSKIYDNFVVINEDKGNKANISAYANVTGNVKLARKFAEGWNTLVLPFSISTDEVNEAFGDGTEVAYFTNNNLNTIELNTKTDGDKTINANEPVLIKPSKDVNEIVDPTFSAKTITSVDEAKVEGANGINFIGSYDSLYTVKAGEYFISGTKLWKSKGKSAIKGTRAYFTVPEAAAGAKIALYINDGDGTTTGIEEVGSEESASSSYNSGVYTLSGQKVANSLEEARKANIKQGVYIVNGKKIIIK